MEFHLEVLKTRVYPRTSPRYHDRGPGRRGYYSPTWREYERTPRIYVFLKDETILENFGSRFDRPARIYRQAVPEALKALGLPADTPVRWSQRAGCSCGCSPGFVVSGGRSIRADCYVSVRCEQPVTERALDRARQLAAQL